MRRLGIAVLLALAAPAAAHADVTIQATDGVLVDGSDNRWTPNAVDIKVGETVTWSFAGTTLPHNVRNAATGTLWTIRSAIGVAGPDASFQFTAAGTYDFYCELHATPMRGTVRVADETGAPPPPPPPPPLSEQPFPNEEPAPELELRDRVRPVLSRVRVSRVRAGARVQFRLSEEGRVTIRVKRGSRTVAARSVRARRNANSVVLRGLRAGTYRVELVARDLAGNAARLQRARLTVSASG